jgi:hypothetical protein
VRLRMRCFDFIFGILGFAKAASSNFDVSSLKNKLMCEKSRMALFWGRSRVRLRKQCFDFIFGILGFAKAASSNFDVSSSKNKLICAKVENGIPLENKFFEQTIF